MAEVIPHWLTKQAYLAPNKSAIELENEEMITFLELKERSQSFAKKLAAIGIKEGTHVGILSNNNSSMVIAVHALSYIGAISVMLNTRLTRNELTYQIEDAEATLILTSVYLEENHFTKPVKTFSEIDQHEEKEIALKTEINLEDVFTIIYTSGTTGFPKGVIHTYGNYWWSAIGSVLNLGLDASDKWLAVLPIFHVGGLSIFIRSVIYGNTVFLVEKFAEKVVHDAIMNNGVTIVSVVTVMLKRLLNLQVEGKYPSNFRGMLLGGGSAPKSLLEQAKSLDIPVFQTYGMTETTSQIVTLSPIDALAKIGSAGKALFPAQLKIAGETGTIGEIHVKGPMVTKGYYNNKEATTDAIKDGWLSTGDLGYVDENDFLYVVDRRSDLIISGGENIYPSEIEHILSNMEEIKEVGVVGLNDDEWGKVPIAFVVPKDNNVSENEILSFAKKYLANYKLPRQVFFVDQLPRNASNKLVRNKLLDMIN